MEILIASLVSILSQLYKWLSGKIGLEKAKALILYVVFILSIAGVLGYQIWFEQIDLKDAETLGRVFLMAIGVYEVFIKRLFVPVMNKFNK